MTNNELVKKVADAAGISQGAAKLAVSEVFSAIAGEVREGGSYTHQGFGTFKQVTRAARQGQNPSTGKPLTIPEKKVLKFNASKSFQI